MASKVYLHMYLIEKSKTDLERNASVVYQYVQASLRLPQEVPKTSDAAWVINIQLVKLRLEPFLVEPGHGLIPPLLVPGSQVDDSIVQLLAQRPHDGETNALVRSCYL